tara:strand:- start:842 stop:1000 length:159 start_codon:yes stop_codon:yes gene_type:complete
LDEGVLEDFFGFRAALKNAVGESHELGCEGVIEFAKGRCVAGGYLLEAAFRG